MAYYPNKYFFSLLTEEEKAAFMTNLEINSEIGYLHKKSVDFDDFITGSFSWHKSPEGSEYWSRIAGSNRDRVVTYIDYLEALIEQSQETEYKVQLEDLTKRFDILQIRYLNLLHMLRIK